MIYRKSMQLHSYFDVNKNIRKKNNQKEKKIVHLIK